MPPTSAPIFDIEIGGKTRKFTMGFRAYKKLELNPFKPDDILAYLSDLTIDKVAAYLQAGMENADIKLKSTEPTMSVEEVIDELDMVQFGAISTAVTKAAQALAKPEAAVSEDAEAVTENP